MKGPAVSGGGQAMRVNVRGNPDQLGDIAPAGFLQILTRGIGTALSFAADNQRVRIRTMKKMVHKGGHDPGSTVYFRGIRVKPLE